MRKEQYITYNEDIISYVCAGHIKIEQNKGILYSTPLGSCIALVTYDTKSKTGGMAHIMLPGNSPRHNSFDNKYAINAINNLFHGFEKSGIDTKNLPVCLIGGANVLKKENDIIAKQLVDNVLNLTKQRNIKIVAKSLGGFERRTAKLNVKTGIVTFTVGNGLEKVLYKFK